ncbi:VCBS repeat-containing protein [Nodosilinea sp. LEGE 07088]|uniref:peroxidase family protein n=1 Tax=Nodosilinea sp. LEGE 07088 TaxID=2777968 RepID=UPI00187E0B79|nr:peroxidase family protein [Nodosilinea sp. LEGE 07088]MBE9137977.1 VCBS repeat-containing protein [Nodosilinea sp. LEGE 07088]
MNGIESLDPELGDVGARASQDLAGLGVDGVALTALGLPAQSHSASLLPVTPQVLPLTPTSVETAGVLVSPTTAFFLDDLAPQPLATIAVGEDTLIGQPAAVLQDAAPSLTLEADAAACILPFTIVAEGQVSINSNSDFDGDPLRPEDDALIYGGRGFTLNGQPVLPVQRDANGSPIVDPQGRPLVVQNAVAVSAAYTTINAPNNLYGGLVPPQIVDTQTVSVPSHAALVEDTLTRQIPAGTVPVIFNRQNKPLNNASDWQNNFPPGGTLENPTVIRITSSGLTIPDQVSLSNTILLLENGNINFNGGGHQLTNVTLVTYNGGVNLSNASGSNLTVMASSQINMNGNVQFAGQSLLASRNSMAFNGTTPSSTDRLTVVSQGNITFNGSSETRAQFLAAGNFSFNSTATLYGRIQAKGNITFNQRATVFAANDAPIVGANKTVVVAEDSGATALNIELPRDLNGDALTLRVSTVPEVSQGVVQLANGSAVVSGQLLTPGELQGLVFVPNADANGAAGSFSYVADDGWCQPASQTVTLQITPVNDGPVVTAPTALALAAGTSLSFATSLQIQDIDAGELPLQVTLGVSHGQLELGAIAASSLILTGSLSELNGQLEQLLYRPAAGYIGEDALAIAVTDQGNTGSGGALTGSATVGLTVTPVDLEPLTVTLALQTDTGSSSADSITSVATITGSVSDANRVARLSAGFGNTPVAEYVDISSYLQNGSFTLDASALATVLGQPLTDGVYTLSVIAEDSLGNVSEPASYSYTLDATSPTLSLVSPIANGDHSRYVHLIGSVDEAVTIATTLGGNAAVSFSASSAGEFDQLLQTLPLTAGAQQLAVVLTDIAGNTVQTTVNFEVSETAFVTGPTETTGWAIATADRLILGESDSYVVQATLPVAVGQSEGRRTLRFAVDAAFDTSDQGAASEDRLALYLVDPANPSQTLLHNGTPGTPLFALEGNRAEFTPGLVRYDGQYVEIDLSGLGDRTEGLLVFQFLNQDGDTGSRVTVSGLTNDVDPEGIAGPRFPTNTALASLGGELDLSTLAASASIKALFSHIRFNASSGEYTAELRLRNTGEESISRRAAVVFAGLPEGVSLVTASGLDADGNGYLNLRDAIRPGGLQAGAISDAIAVTFSNPEQLRLVLTPQVLVGGPNQSPIFPELGPLTAMPGQKLEIPLTATDPDGDRVTYSIRSAGNLPKSRLNGSGQLIFEPRPDQIGTYDFTLIATDGAAETTQQVSLTVAPDPDPTTRISGRILDANGNPLANMPLALGRLQATTDAEGYFTLAIPPTSFPTEEINIQIPLGDAAFDPFFTGTSEINLRRTTFDGATGTSLSNPLRHPNLVSTFLDANMVYGSDANRAAALRTNDGTGRLKVSDGDLLPINNSTFFPDGTLTNDNRGLTDPATLFATGDVRANENIALTAVHTVFVREHNRLADELRAANPELSGEDIYQRARKLVAAQIQHITYSEYLPLLIGDNSLTDYAGYDADVDPSISHLFSAAAFRMGHTQSFDEFLLIDGDGQALPSISLNQSTFNPGLVQQYGIDAILRGLFAQSSEAIDTKVLSELRNTLFGPPGSGGIDLAAVDIQRGRDVGLPDYNQARVDFGLAPVTSFAEITSDVSVQAVLAQVYGTVNDIDAIVGGLAEDAVAGSMVGEFFQTVIADQFARLRDGDRFWYENGQFTAEELGVIRGTSLSALLSRNTGMNGLADNLFSTGRTPAALAQGGTAAGQSGTEYATLDGSNNNLANPELGRVGTQLRVDYTQEYGDGIRSLAGEERANVRDISNAIFAQDASIPDPTGATGFMLAWSQFLGHDMTLSPAGAADTLKVYGTQYTSATGEVFPFIAEKLNLVLGHEVYAGVNNVIDRPIYLPALDIASNTSTVDSSGDTTIANSTLGAQVWVKANSLTDNRGNPFTGSLSISEVPPDFTPAALPEGLSPDLVVTIQPGEMVFTEPARLTLPNRAGWPAGYEMDLWSINPTTGDFEIVGKGTVSDDGQSVETTEGGIRNSSWHFFVPPRPLVDLNLRVEDNTCSACLTPGKFSSQVELNTGAVIETHALPTYQSLGADRGVQLTYDSLRADARPIVQFGGDLRADRATNAFLAAKLTIHNGDFDYQVPGSSPRAGLRGGEHFWALPTTSEPISAALQADLRDFESGVYDFSLTAGTYLLGLTQFSGLSRTNTGQLVHVNTVNSAFGSGWGLAGVQELIETSSGSVLLIDGDGSELVFAKDGNGYQSPPGDFSVLEKLADGTFRRTEKDQTVYSFDAENHLVSVKDANGNETQHIYTDGRLTKVVDPVGLETTFTYAGARVSAITDPANRTTRFDYDAAGNLIRITDPDGTRRTFEYDQAHHMTAEIDKRGNREEAAYDFAGRATHATDKTGATIRVSPTQTQALFRPEQTTQPITAPAISIQVLNSASYADANGSVTQSTLDGAGQTISAFDGSGTQGLTERNDSNLVTRRLSGRGRETLYTYDERGNLLSVDDEISRASTPRSDFFTGRITRSNQPSSVITVDVNNDGKLDYITTNADGENGSLSIFYGDGQGTFSGGQPIFGLEASSSTRATDLDRDGNLDLVVLERGYGYPAANPSVNVLWGNGNGGFERSHISRRPLDPYDDYSLLSQGDIDGDGDDDLLVKDYVFVPGEGYQEQVKALFNQGNRTFAETTLIVGPERYRTEIQLGDLDGDGDLDAIVHHGFDGAGAPVIQTFLYAGNNAFGAPNIVVDTSAGYSSPISPIWAVDANQDGNADVLLLNPNAPDNGALEVYLSAGNGTFLPPVRHDPGVDIYGAQIVVADVNGDGQTDVIAIDEGTDQLSVSIANGQGGFATAALYSVGNYSASVHGFDNIDRYGLNISGLKTGDVDGNGATDIITANYDDNTVTVLYNDGDGTFSNRVDYSAGQNPAAIAMGDVNQDGQLDVISAGENNVFLENIDGRLEAKVSGSAQADSVLPVDSAFSERGKTLADLNDDGLLDFVGFQSNGNLSIAYGGGGTFAPPVVRSIVGPNGVNIEIGDIDGDGFQDVVFTARFATSGSTHLKLWMLKGDGTADLGALESIDVGITANRLALGDFNGDGKLDVLLEDRSRSKLLLNNAAGTGAFTQLNLTNLPFYNDLLAVGDVNGDGRDEFIWQRTETVDEREFSYLSVFSLRPDGSVAVVAEYDLNGASEYSQLDRFYGDINAVEVVDFNQDGRQDLVVTHDVTIQHQGALLERGYVSVFLAQAGAPAVRVDSPGLYASASRLNLGDVNVDGQLDVVVNSYDRTLLLLGEADGTFKPQNRADYSPLAFSNGAVFLADLDLDGDADLVDVSTSELSVRLSNAAGDTASQVGARRYTYDTVFNQLTSMTDELGRQTLYTVDGATGNRLAMTQVVGAIDSAANGETDDVVTSYTYTSNGLLDIETDPLGRQTDYDYDTLGRLMQATYAKGTTDEAIWQYEYNAAGNQTALIDPNGHRTEYVFDALNRMTTITYAKGTPEEAIEYFFYDDAGNQTAVIDANGNRSETLYDSMNRAIQTTTADPDGIAGPLASPISTQTYDRSGNLVATTDPIGRQTRYLYDSRNRLVTTILPDGTEQLNRYDFDNNPVSRRDANGEATQSIYDARGRLVAMVDESGDRTQFVYDAANQMTAQIDANGVRTEYTYDDLGRRITMTSAARTTTTITTTTEYDKVGNTLAQTDGLGQRTEMEYDNLDRLILTRDAEDPAGETTYTYDAAGNLLSLSDAVNNTTTFGYDARDRLVSETNAFNSTRSHEYDAVGNRVETTDRNGRTRRFSFDGLNRQTQEAWLDDQGNPLRTTTMAYDAADQLIAVQDPNSAYTFGYDALGRRVQVSNAGTTGVPTVVLSYGYDADGNVISVSDFINGVAGGVTTYTYDAEDRVVQMTQSGAGVDAKRVDFAYDAIGQFESITRYSDLADTMPVVTTGYAYDEHNRLERLAHSNGSGEVAFYGFAYDDANRITQIADVDGVTDYSYNARNELTGADHSDINNPDEVYDYDANGNRIESHLHGTGYGTGTNNQLVSDGIYTYAYDAEGNMTTQTEIATGNQRVFVWDYLNRLVAVIDENTVGAEVQRAEYVYDVMNRRIAKTIDADGAGSAAAETLRFVYDRENVLLEFKGNIADPSMRYLYGPQVDQVLAQEDATGTTLWHLSDHLGSVKDLVDDSGALKNHRTYDSYGNLVGESDSSFDSRYAFTGREFDAETGLHYYRARYYDGELGQFISEDPIGFNGGDGNLYGYVGNSPTIAVDPSGLETLIYHHESFPGHLAIDVDGTVFTYGRYRPQPNTSSLGAIGDGVLYMIPREQYLRPNNTFRGEDVSIERWRLNYTEQEEEEEQIKSFFRKLFNGGAPVNSIELDNGTDYVGVRIDRYNLLGNNCTTITLDSLPNGSILGALRDYLFYTPYTTSPSLPSPTAIPSPANFADALDSAANSSNSVVKLPTLHAQ